MTRRTVLLAWCARPLLPETKHAPTDENQLNHFAGLYNGYVERLKSGLIDMKAWSKVERAWTLLNPHE